MVKWFCIQIKAGKITIDDVPKKWRDTVREALEQ